MLPIFPAVVSEGLGCTEERKIKMIDRLHNALSYLEQLPPEAQEEAATYIETLVEAWRLALITDSHAEEVPSQEPTNVEWQDPFGAWSDLPDTVLDDLDQIRHASRPTPPLELP
jgi:hypothetical protein